MGTMRKRGGRCLIFMWEGENNHGMVKLLPSVTISEREEIERFTEIRRVIIKSVVKKRGREG